MRWLGSGKADPPVSAMQERLERLAGRIQSLAQKDEQTLRHAHEIGEMRRDAAGQLHGVCTAFVHAVNALLGHSEVELDPPDYGAGSFHEDGVNLIQINVRGRIVQIEFESTPELVSTEDFRVPYTLAGSIRCFNQELLERDTVEEHLIFYCLEKAGRQWRFFDARTYRSGPLDEEYLVSLMERLI